MILVKIVMIDHSTTNKHNKKLIEVRYSLKFSLISSHCMCVCIFI